mgnify:CR=1 FL=1
MFRVSVVSSNLRSVGYDPATAVLEVEFHGGGVYHYYGVPDSVYQGLMSAASKGGYLADHVKGVYRYRRIG